MTERDRQKFSGRKLVSEANNKSHAENQPPPQSKSQSQSQSQLQSGSQSPSQQSHLSNNQTNDKQTNDKQTDNINVQRLNKAVASTGYCSRRRADELIREGRVRVNGEKITDFSYAVDFSKDSLTVDDQPISKKQFDYLILNKPRGVVTTCDDEFGRENVLELLPAHFSHLKPVGRLDLESEGLLILTNDGELTQKLTHPSKHVLKNYEVTISGRISDVSLDSFRQGMELSDGPTQPAKVRLLERNKDLSRFQIAIAEGRNRQIRRMCAQVGHPIIRLIRVAIGGLQLKGLESGQWRHLTQAEFNAFFQDS